MQQNSPAISPIGRPAEAVAPLHSWTLRNGADSIRCALYAAGDRVDLRIESGGSIAISQRCAGREQADGLSSAWRAAFESRGWTEDPGPVRLAPKADRRQSAAL
jgi:hypothetical protein